MYGNGTAWNAAEEFVLGPYEPGTQASKEFDKIQYKGMTQEGIEEPIAHTGINLLLFFPPLAEIVANQLQKYGIVVDKKLGSGQFGDVWKGTLDNTPVAIKLLQVSLICLWFNKISASVRRHSLSFWKNSVCWGKLNCNYFN